MPFIDDGKVLAIHFFIVFCLGRSSFLLFPEMKKMGIWICLTVCYYFLLFKIQKNYYVQVNTLLLSSNLKKVNKKTKDSNNLNILLYKLPSFSSNWLQFFSKLDKNVGS